MYAGMQGGSSASAPVGTGHIYVMNAETRAQFHLTVELADPRASTGTTATAATTTDTADSMSSLLSASGSRARHRSRDRPLTRVTGRALRHTIETVLVPLAINQSNRGGDRSLSDSSGTGKDRDGSSAHQQQQQHAHPHRLSLLPAVHGHPRRDVDDAMILPDGAVVEVIPCTCGCQSSRQRSTTTAATATARPSASAVRRKAASSPSSLSPPLAAAKASEERHHGTEDDRHNRSQRRSNETAGPLRGLSQERPPATPREAEKGTPVMTKTVADRDMRVARRRPSPSPSPSPSAPSPVNERPDGRMTDTEGDPRQGTGAATSATGAKNTGDDRESKDAYYYYYRPDKSSPPREALARGGSPVSTTPAAVVPAAQRVSRHFDVGGLGGLPRSHHKSTDSTTDGSPALERRGERDGDDAASAFSFASVSTPTASLGTSVDVAPRDDIRATHTKPVRSGSNGNAGVDPVMEDWKLTIAAADRGADADLPLTIPRHTRASERDAVCSTAETAVPSRLPPPPVQLASAPTTVGSFPGLTASPSRPSSASHSPHGRGRRAATSATPSRSFSSPAATVSTTPTTNVASTTTSASAAPAFVRNCVEASPPSPQKSPNCVVRRSDDEVVTPDRRIALAPPEAPIQRRDSQHRKVVSPSASPVPSSGSTTASSSFPQPSVSPPQPFEDPLPQRHGGGQAAMAASREKDRADYPHRLNRPPDTDGVEVESVPREGLDENDREYRRAESNVTSMSSWTFRRPGRLLSSPSSAVSARTAPSLASTATTSSRTLPLTSHGTNVPSLLERTIVGGGGGTGNAPSQALESSGEAGSAYPSNGIHSSQPEHQQRQQQSPLPSQLHRRGCDAGVPTRTAPTAIPFTAPAQRSLSSVTSATIADVMVEEQKPATVTPRVVLPVEQLHPEAAPQGEIRESELVRALREAIAQREADLIRAKAAAVAKLDAMHAHMDAERRRIDERRDKRIEELQREMNRQAKQREAEEARRARERRHVFAEQQEARETANRMRDTLTELNGVYDDLFGLWEASLRDRRQYSARNGGATGCGEPPMTAFAWQDAFQRGKQLTQSLCEGVAYAHVLKAKRNALRLAELEQQRTLDDLTEALRSLAYVGEDRKGAVRIVVRVRPAKDHVLRTHRAHRLVHSQRQHQQGKDPKRECEEATWQETVDELLSTVEVTPTPFAVEVDERSGTVVVHDITRPQRRFTFDNLYGPPSIDGVSAVDNHPRSNEGGFDCYFDNDDIRGGSRRRCIDSKSSAVAAASALIDEEVAQARLFTEQLAPVLHDACQRGRRVSVLGYGATGSGKTHTLLGATLSHVLYLEGGGNSGGGNGDDQREDESRSKEASPTQSRQRNQQRRSLDSDHSSDGDGRYTAREDERKDGFRYGGDDDDGSVLRWCIVSSGRDSDHEDSGCDDSEIASGGIEEIDAPIAYPGRDRDAFHVGRHAHHGGSPDRREGYRSSVGSASSQDRVRAPTRRLNHVRPGDGLLPRTLAWLCDRMHGRSSSRDRDGVFFSRRGPKQPQPQGCSPGGSDDNCEPQVIYFTLSAFEVYNDHVYDLLADPIPDCQPHNIPYKPDPNASGPVTLSLATAASNARRGRDRDSGSTWPQVVVSTTPHMQQGRDTSTVAAQEAAHPILCHADDPNAVPATTEERAAWAQHDKGWDHGHVPKDAFRENPLRLVELVPFHEGVKRGSGGTGSVVDTGSWTVAAHEVRIEMASSTYSGDDGGGGGFRKGMRCLRLAAARRRTYATARNTTSSRSHMFVKIKARVVPAQEPGMPMAVHGGVSGYGCGGTRARIKHCLTKDGADTMEPQGHDVQLIFCDLAGSERLDDFSPIGGGAAVFATLRRESKYINRSLCAVADLLTNLTNQPPPPGLVETAKATLLRETIDRASYTHPLASPSSWPLLTSSASTATATHTDSCSGYGMLLSSAFGVDRGVNAAVRAPLAADLRSASVATSMPPGAVDADDQHGNISRVAGGTTPPPASSPPPAAAVNPISAWPALVPRHGIHLSSRVGEPVFVNVDDTAASAAVTVRTTTTTNARHAPTARASGRETNEEMFPSAGINAPTATPTTMGGTSHSTVTNANVRTTTVRSVTRRSAAGLAASAALTGDRGYQLPTTRETVAGTGPTPSFSTSSAAAAASGTSTAGQRAQTRRTTAPFRSDKVTMLLQPVLSGRGGSGSGAGGAHTDSVSATFVCFACVSPCTLGEVMPRCVFHPTYTDSIATSSAASTGAGAGKRTDSPSLADVRRANAKRYPSTAPRYDGSVGGPPASRAGGENKPGTTGSGGVTPGRRPPSASAMLQRMYARYDVYAPLLAAEARSTLAFASQCAKPSVGTTGRAQKV